MGGVGGARKAAFELLLDFSDSPRTGLQESFLSFFLFLFLLTFNVSLCCNLSVCLSVSNQPERGEKLEGGPGGQLVGV